MRSARFLTFDGWNTSIDGHYTLSSLAFDLPAVQEQRQAIAGMDGDLDYTDALAGRPIYKTRALKAMLSSSFGNRAERIAVFHELVNRVHGKRCAITLPDRPGLTAYGRLSVTMKTDHLAYTEVEINATCDPFLSDGKERAETIAELSADTDNLLTADNVVYMSQRSTCSSGMFNSLVYSFAVEGEVGSRAVYQITLSPNSDYCIAGRISSGRCAWFVSPDPDAQSGTAGEFRTDSTGVVYLIVKKSNVERCTVSPVVLMRSSGLTRIDTGVAASSGHFTYERISGSGVHTVVLIVNNHLNVYSHIDADISLQSGQNDVAIISLRNAAAGQLHLTWEKVTL